MLEISISWWKYLSTTKKQAPPYELQHVTSFLWSCSLDYMNEKSQTMSWSLHKLETFFRIIHLPINPAWFAVCVCLAVKSCMAAIALAMPAIFLAIDSCHYFGNNNLVMFVSEELHFDFKLRVRKVKLKMMLENRMD